MRNLLLSLLLFSFITPSFADVFEHKTSLKTVSSTLPELENIKCQFKQEKILKNI